MKKIWFMMLMVLSMVSLAACSDDDEGTTEVQNPVSGVKVPVSGTAGEEVIIQGTGFTTQGIVLYLEDSAKERIKLNASFTSAGATFTLPATLKAGTYAVYLTQVGKEWKIGTMIIDAMGMPIMDVQLPLGIVNPSQKIIIKGTDYAEGDKISLQLSDAEPVLVSTAAVTTNGLEVTLPETLVEGDYQVNFVRGEVSWPIDGILQVKKARRIVSLVLNNDMLSATLTPEYDENNRIISLSDENGSSWEFTYGTDEVTTLSLMTGVDLTFKLNNDRVISSTAFDAYDETEAVNNWNYDNGYLVSITNPGELYEGVQPEMMYDASGNLEQITLGYSGEYNYSYTESTAYAYPGSMNPAIALQLPSLLLGKEDVFLGLFLDMHSTNSSAVPSEISIPEQTETVETIYTKYPLTVNSGDDYLEISTTYSLIGSIRINYEVLQ